MHGGNRSGRGEGSLAREGIPMSDKAVVLATYQKTNAPPKKASDGTWAKRPFGTTAPLPPASLIFIPASRSPGPTQEAPVRSWEGSDQEWTGLDLAPILWAHKPHPGSPGPLPAWGRAQCPQEQATGQKQGQGDSLHLDTGRRHHPDGPSPHPGLLPRGS